MVKKGSNLMQQFVSNLIQFNAFQWIVLAVHLLGFFIFAIIAMVSEKTAGFVSAVFAIMIAIGSIIALIAFRNESLQEVQNHKYVAIKEGKTLEIESRSDLIRSRKLEIDSEDSKRIYVKVNGFFSSHNVIIDKSEIDEVKD